MLIKTASFLLLLSLAGSAFAQEAQPAPGSVSGSVPNATPPAGSASDNAPNGTPPAPAGPVNPPMTGPQILISTSLGDITLQLDQVRAPKSVADILRYVREKHYDGTSFYRVAKGFVIQMGSWDAKMKGRSVHPGLVTLESGNGLSNLRGTAALAHGDDPDSATAEFFINVGDNSALDSKSDNPVPNGFAVFGQVVSGMDIVDQINAAPVGDGGPMPGQTPVDPVVIKKVSVIGDPPPKAPAKKKS